MRPFFSSDHHFLFWTILLFTSFLVGDASFVITPSSLQHYYCGHYSTIFRLRALFPYYDDDKNASKETLIPKLQHDECNANIVRSRDLTEHILTRRQVHTGLTRSIGAITLMGSGVVALLPSNNNHAAMAAMAARSGATIATTSYLREVRDPNTLYSALAYVNPTLKTAKKKVPLLVVLHGAGKNENDNVWSELADPQGEHAGLVPSLLMTNKTPRALTDNFAVVAPYVGAGKRSFYEEPRSKLRAFVDWVCSEQGQQACFGGTGTSSVANSSFIDTNRILLFGFSDGATVAVELATTRRFKACIICAYGYSGILPALALERLKGIYFWVFHSADDVIFPVAYSDQLVKSLRSVNGGAGTDELVRYTRFESDQEGFTGSVKGHSVGITASKMPDIYNWMLSIP